MAMRSRGIAESGVLIADLCVRQLARQGVGHEVSITAL